MDSLIFPPIPPDTSKAASAFFDRSNFYIAVGDQANQIFNGFIFNSPPSHTKLSLHMNAMIYLITIFQIRETLPDQDAAEAVRNRVDWKYALHLPLSYPGQDASVFCEFRKWMLSDPVREEQLDALIHKVNKLIEAPDRTNISFIKKHFLAHICLISRVLDAYDSVSKVLEILATQKPELLRPISLPHWYKRYSHNQKESIPGLKVPQLEALAESIGLDITHLLKSISTSDLNSMTDQPEIASLKRVWREQYAFAQGKWTWRKDACAQCSLSSSANKFL